MDVCFKEDSKEDMEKNVLCSRLLQVAQDLDAGHVCNHSPVQAIREKARVLGFWKHKPVKNQ